MITNTPVTPPDSAQSASTKRLAWRRPTLRRIDALDAQAGKGRAPHDALHLS